jgi:hypothetical protein
MSTLARSLGFGSIPLRLSRQAGSALCPSARGRSSSKAVALYHYLFSNAKDKSKETKKNICSISQKKFSNKRFNNKLREN